MDDLKIMDRWQELANRKDPNISIYDDSVQMFLFSHFLDEDIEEAWSILPEHKEILGRLHELEDVRRRPDELDGIPAYVCPSRHNVANDEQIEMWIQEHLRNIADVWSRCADECYMDEYQICINKFRTDFRFVRVKQKEVDGSRKFHEDFCFFAESLDEAILEEDVNQALYNYFTYLTKADDVTYYLLTPRIIGIAGITEHTFEPGFRLWANNVEFDYGEEGIIVYWIEPT